MVKDSTREEDIQWQGINKADRLPVIRNPLENTQLTQCPSATINETAPDCAGTQVPAFGNSLSMTIITTAHASAKLTSLA